MIDAETDEKPPLASASTTRPRRRDAAAGKMMILLVMMLAAPGWAWAAAAEDGDGSDVVADSEPAADTADAADDADGDDDSDSAPFMIVVEHKWGDADSAYWHCSGALVSLRTGVTSAGCARRRDNLPAKELWAVAAAAAAGLASRNDGARRVSRIATAGAADDASAAAWGGAVLDMAVLELERPFGSAARARPILMATAPDECGAAGSVCHVVRTQSGAGASPLRRTRLRIVDAVLAPEAKCAPLMRFWPALRDRALCLSGPELCSSDWGAGVVCGGKLCGVVSRSARSADGVAGAAATPQCGDTHAAQSVARWRRFLHCAHTLRACGRGACAELCTERRLTEEVSEISLTSVTTSAEPAPSPHTPRLRPCSSADLAHLAPPRDEYSGRDEVTVSVMPPTRLRPAISYVFEDVTSSALRPKERTAHAGTRRSPTRTPQLPSPPPPPPGAADDDAAEPMPVEPEPPSASPSPPPPPPPRPSPHVVYESPRTAAEPSEPSEISESSVASVSVALSTSPRLTPAARPPSIRPTPLFEPNRPDFKAGEYGDSADYAAPVDESRSHPHSSSSSVAAPQPAPLPAHLPAPVAEHPPHGRFPPAPAQQAPPPRTAVKKRRKKIVTEKAAGSQPHRLSNRWHFVYVVILMYLYF